MKTYSEMDKHYDRHNDGICADCGCTINKWEYRCRHCMRKPGKEIIKDAPKSKQEEIK